MTTPVRFPLDGEDGCYPGEIRCCVCGRKPIKGETPEWVRISLGSLAADHSVEPGEGVQLDFVRDGKARKPEDTHRQVQVLPPSDDPEALIEFCSMHCLRMFFESIIEALRDSLSR